MSAKMTIFAHRLFLIFGETKVIEKGRLLQMESTLILSCNKKVYRTAIIFYSPKECFYFDLSNYLIIFFKKVLRFFYRNYSASLFVRSYKTRAFPIIIRKALL